MFCTIFDPSAQKQSYICIQENEEKLYQSRFLLNILLLQNIILKYIFMQKHKSSTCTKEFVYFVQVMISNFLRSMLFLSDDNILMVQVV